MELLLSKGVRLKIFNLWPVICNMVKYRWKLELLGFFFIPRLSIALISIFGFSQRVQILITLFTTTKCQHLLVSRHCEILWSFLIIMVDRWLDKTQHILLVQVKIVIIILWLDWGWISWQTQRRLVPALVCVSLLYELSHVCFDLLPTHNIIPFDILVD